MEQRISLERMEEAVSLFGSFDENIRLLENEFHVTVVNREEQLIINGEPEDTMLAAKAIEALLRLISKGENVGEQHVRYVIGLCRSGQSDRIDELTRDVICISAKGRPIKPKTIGQKDYIKTIQQKPVTIGVGPAGTGKTYLAVAAAVAAFREKEVSRTIRFAPSASTASSSRARRWRPASGWAFCPATCRARWILTCGRCMTPCLTCWGRRRIRNIWKRATSRWRRWPTCGGGRWTTASSFWTRRRTPVGSR